MEEQEVQQPTGPRLYSIAVVAERDDWTCVRTFMVYAFSGEEAVGLGHSYADRVFPGRDGWEPPVVVADTDVIGREQIAELTPCDPEEDD